MTGEGIRERLGDLGRAPVERRAGGVAGSIVDRLREPRRTLRAAYSHFAAASRRGEESTPAAEWLLDNYYIVERAFRLVEEDFPRPFERRLPRLASGTHRGQPFAYAVAREIVDTQGHIDLQEITQLLDDLQAIRPLTIAESWALPILLRVALLERLAAALAEPASDEPRDGSIIADEELSLERIVAGCIQGLRTLDSTDWKDFFERINKTEEILRQDPAEVYARTDFETRDRCRRMVEELSIHGALSEPEVASTAIGLARRSAGGRTAHVGYYLIDVGFDSLAAEVSYRPPLPVRWRRTVKRHPTAFYLSSVAFIAAIHEVVLCVFLGRLGAAPGWIVASAILGLVPSTTIAVSLVHSLITHAFPPWVLPKMDFRDGIPDDCRTLLAIPVILHRMADVENLLARMEIHWLASSDHVQVALLSDFPDAPRESMPDDEELLERLRAGVERLNQVYGNGETGPFHLLHRARRWNPLEGCWMGWERKRGKLSELNRLICGEADTTFALHVGDPAQLRSIRFVITLDADTQIPRGTARRLIATLAHPLNRAEFDRQTGRVTSGYTILQPRVDTAPQSTSASHFARLFAGDTGIDLYARAISDAFQDLFGEGIYFGKGIYDVRAFEWSTSGRIPENAILSHDLFEGLHGRVGLATDIAFLESYPGDYLSYSKRLHRWVRGDWQLLPWLGRRVPNEQRERVPSRFSLMARWKIADNLRRSLLAPSLIAFLIVAWLWLPGAAAVWTVLAILVPAAPALTEAMGGVLASGGLAGLPLALAGVASNLRSAAGLWALHITFLPHRASVVADAIVRTLYRLFVSHRKLLEWVTAEEIMRGTKEWTSRRGIWMEMIAGPATALALAASIAFLRPAALPAALSLLLLWLVSPEVALRISRPQIEGESPLSAGELQRLRRLARRTWLFFESFVGPADQWLPPDHFQENPRGVLARRTSPTNIGLLQLATLSAFDLGYVGLVSVVLRLRNTMDTLTRMERHGGHFYNWYDTHNLEPLEPRYVSTVDSGNLAACLLALKQFCRGLPDTQALQPVRWQGLLDTFDVLDEIVQRGARIHGVPRFADLHSCLSAVRNHIVQVQNKPAAWAAAIDEISTTARADFDAKLLEVIQSGREELDADLLTELRVWLTSVHEQLQDMRRDLELCRPWAALFSDVPDLLRRDECAPVFAALEQSLDSLTTLSQLEGVAAVAAPRLTELEERLSGSEEARQTARDWLRRLAESLTRVQETARSLILNAHYVAETAATLFHEMDFTTLYDPRRRLFHLGYNVTANAMDPHHYDLLASEARLASVVAIAKGEAPYEHWLYLGRPMRQIGGKSVLLSWSATMFEYLMPPLLLREGSDTLLGQSCRAAVRSQIAYGRNRGTPWGISESGYYLFDGQQNYQYRAFGLPDLGFKRGLEEDHVVTPYASLLALRYEPREVLENIDRLEREGLAGRYGFYEAVDYTTSRLPLGARQGVVRSFMAHHQGMILTALNNYLNADILVRRFHAEPLVKTAEVLLYERPPYEIPTEKPRPAVPLYAGAPRRPSVAPFDVPLDAPFPQAHVLSNGRYHLLMTDRGSVARWRDVALTRWCPDATLDSDGLRLELRDTDSGTVWAMLSPKGDRSLRFHAHMIERGHQAEGIAVWERVTVSPDADIEVHLMRLTNQGSTTRRLSLTSAIELVLGDEREDRRHPAFSKLFVESEYLPDLHAIVAHRRRRARQDPVVWMAHSMAVPETGAQPSGYEISRDRLLGRNRTSSALLVLRRVGAAPSSVEAPIDPVVALSADIEIPPHQTATVAYTFSVGGSREEVIELARRHRTTSDLEWQLDLARSRYESKLSQLPLFCAHFAAMQKLLSLLVYPHSALRAAPSVLVENHAGQPSLWRHGISGDHPILLCRIDEKADPGVVRTLLQAHRHWRECGIPIDLVVLNERATGYADEVEQRTMRLVAREGSSELFLQRGGIFLVRGESLNQDERSILLSAARAVLDAREGDVEGQIVGAFEVPGRLPPFEPPLDRPFPSAPLPRPSDLLFDNGIGGFSPDGRAYVIHLEPGAATPAPWVNVIANPHFGAIVSESGGGCTWAENSGENQLTPWCNDPVLDLPGDVVYLRDEETGTIWTPTPQPAPAPYPYQCRHAAGYTAFRHRSQGLDQELHKFVAWNDPVQIVTLRLTNDLDRARRITATYYVEWMLGRTRDLSEMFIIPEFDAESGALLARNPWNGDFGSRVAFVAASEKLHGLTGDRAEFLGRHGDYARPAALGRIGLASAVAPGLDPCAALQVHIDLAPGGTAEIHFLLGQAADRAAAVDLVHKYRTRDTVRNVFDEVCKQWDDLLDTVTVETPRPELDLMVNRWLLYQTIACRLWGRSSQYQSSGAFGFRDQLQDVMALVHTKPELCRAHILEAARHQFEEGDVLHWWHPPSGAGVRTRCSDDLLWLPFVTAHYVAVTGDEAILDESLPLLSGVPLEAEKAEVYARFRHGVREESLYEHCCAAIRRGQTAGAHGLPLFGAGDWNDGMNRVGIQGRGESVWLGWFLYATLARFAPLCERRGEPERAAALREDAEKLRQALEASAWDGAWYRRGYYDDGSPLGSAQNDECRIDSIAQSWALLSSAAEPERASRAMDAVCEFLCGENGLVRLLAPPFREPNWKTGYIASYPPGVRENGGQYTHAAIWVVWALASLGDGDRAADLLEKLLPITHASNAERAARYRVEPYVVAADIYAGEPYNGRGGWTWYTGAAGWMYRVAVEAILGIRLEAEGLRLDPCIPRVWSGFKATVRDGSTIYEIRVENPARINRGVREVTLDGKSVSNLVIPRLRDGRRHEVRVQLGLPEGEERQRASIPARTTRAGAR